jgi:hypothetical protein
MRFAPGRRRETDRATARALNFAPLLCALRDQGESLTGIARQLTLMEIETPRGRSQWTFEQVQRMFVYAGERLPKRHANYRSQAERRATMLRFPIVRLD